MGKAGRPPKRQPSDLAKKLRGELFATQEKTLNVTDVAHVLDRDESTVLRIIRSGDLPATKRGREYEIAESDLREYVERKEQQRREDISRGRIKREVQEEYEQIRGTPAADWWSYQICPDCRSPMLLRARRPAGSPEYWCWHGTCRACHRDHKFVYSSNMRISVQNAGKQTVTNSQEDQEVNEIDPDDIPFPF